MAAEEPRTSGSAKGSSCAPLAASFLAIVGGNDVTWRVEWPAQAVGGKAILIREDEARATLEWPNRDTDLPWRIVATTEDGSRHLCDTASTWGQFTETRQKVTSMFTQFPTVNGPVVFARPSQAANILAATMRMNGIRTLAETDDNYFADSKHNLFLRQHQIGKPQQLVSAKAMVQNDANVFSTEWLRDRYWREYRELFGKKGLPEMHVCHNHIPRENWPEPVERDGPLRVGFMGSPSHVWDVNIAYAAFHAAKEFGCTTTMIGYNPADPDPDMPDEVNLDGEILKTHSEKSMEIRGRWAKVIDRHIRWVSPGKYHRTPLPLDIGLCPLLYNDFTLGKSDVKAIEYSVSGAAVVASNHPVYTTAGWEHEVNCLLAGSQEEMGWATVRLIREPRLRAELVENAREMVRERRNEVVMRDEWMAALYP